MRCGTNGTPRQALIHDRLFWCTPPEQHGLLVCPEFQYGPSLAYSGDTWTNIAEWRACAEQKREVFYVRDGLVHYAGTFICHSGPSSLQLNEPGKLKTEILVRAIARETRTAKKKNKAERELVTIEQLYREGALTVHVLGLERIGFNNALYRRLASRYHKSQRGIKSAPVIPVAAPAAPVPYYVSPQIPATPVMNRNHWYYGALQTVPAAPVAGPSHTHYAMPPAAPVAGNLLPPSSYIANIAQKRSKRTREDDGFDRLERAAKYARLPTPDYDKPEDDEGYPFHLGGSYYRDMLDDDPLMYDGLDIPDIMGEMMAEEDRAAEEGSFYSDEEDNGSAARQDEYYSDEDEDEE